MATDDRRGKSPILSHSPISKLGNDLLIEILIRLPNPKYVFRSKSVCKRWNSLISTPYFARRFGSHHIRIHPAGESKPSIQESISTFLPLPTETRSRFSVLDCFKDLLLLGFNATQNDNSDELARTFFVCNPFTKQWVALPLSPERWFRYNTFIAKLVCKPCLNDGEQEGVVFTCEYRFRVVRLYEHIPDPQVDVFCSESGEWMKLGLNLGGDLRRCSPYNHIVSLNNGGLCWQSCGGQVVEWDPFRGLDDHHKAPTLINTLPEHDFSTKDLRHWMVFQPRIHLWPTPIPSYEKLRRVYDGSYNCWFQPCEHAAE